jgi:hypothetical protein
MPNLSKPYETFERPGLVINYPVAAVNLYKGALLAAGADGNATQLSPSVASLRFLGVALQSVNNAAGPAGSRRLTIGKAGCHVFKAATGYAPAQADIGKEVYAATDWEVQLSTAGLTHAYKVGTIVAIETTESGQAGVRVRIDNYTV